MVVFAVVVTLKLEVVWIKKQGVMVVLVFIEGGGSGVVNGRGGF